MGYRVLLAVLTILVAALVTGCPTEEHGRTCVTNEECGDGEYCLDGYCEDIPSDGDADTDADGDGDGDADGDADGDGDGDADGDIAPPLPDFPDTDGDGISDLHEGLGAVDTDGDGTPDTEDLDSDGDGISDADEAGDDDDTTPPDDTDRDGTPDFRDLDADGDGIADGVEGDGDTDGDGTPDFLDIDSDGDGLGDFFEGVADADGDGVGNYLDDDSDGDGVPDELEAGDEDPSTMPPDSDGDDVYDFLDLDADGDTIPDGVEGTDDPDGDGIASFRDPDADNDGVPDELEAGDADPATPPIDADGDGVPNYLDGDSDGDTISDAHEYVFDTDRDGTHDYIDLDSDDDGMSDGAEAGDGDAMTPPVDTDGDGLPDFRDTDSDNDGLSDRAESTTHHTDPYDDDSDGDGVTDLIEVAAGTDPHSAADNPRARGDFVFLEPYEASPDPTEDTLSFSTDIQVADVYFLMDTTGSMGGEISNLRTSLSSSVIPGIQAAIPDVWFGVGSFDDYPYSPYGSAGSGDLAYRHHQDMTSSAPAAQSAVNSLVTHYGADGPESDIPALHAIATGCGDGGGSYGIANDPDGACTNPALIGYPHFRGGSVPIIIVMTDWAFHNGTNPSYNYGSIPGVTPPSYSQTVDALNAIHARVIGVNSGSARPDLEAIAHDTGTIGAIGELVYDISGTGTGLGSQVVDAVEELVDSVPMDITAVPVDDPTDSVDAVSSFIERLVPNTTAGGACATGLTTMDYDGDGVHDTFVNVSPGLLVCFDVIPRENTTVPPTEDPQTFMATIQVWGDHVTVVDERDVFFLVPPEVPGGQ